jgi:hypothetical protein
MFRFTEPQIDRIIGHRHRLLLIGSTAMALPFLLPRGWGFGFLSGLMLWSLGIYGFKFRRWRTEPGVWMLAVLLTVLLGPCWLYFEALYWRSILDQPAARALTWAQIGLAIDAIGALVLLGRIVKLASSVAIENWQRTRGSARAVEPPPPYSM